MIVTTGKSIKIDVGCHLLRLERSCETPGAVHVTDRNGRTVVLPANDAEREMFIAAYRRACAEDVPYRKSEAETIRPTEPGSETR